MQAKLPWRYIGRLAIGDLASHEKGTLEPSWNVDPELGEQAADHVDQLGALLNEEIARSVQGQSTSAAIGRIQTLAA